MCHPFISQVGQPVSGSCLACRWAEGLLVRASSGADSGPAAMTARRRSAYAWPSSASPGLWSVGAVGGTGSTFMASAAAAVGPGEFEIGYMAEYLPIAGSAFAGNFIAFKVPADAMSSRLANFFGLGFHVKQQIAYEAASRWLVQRILPSGQGGRRRASCKTCQIYTGRLQMKKKAMPLQAHAMGLT